MPLEKGVDGWPREAGNPATHALDAIGITCIEDLVTRTERELLALHGIGPKAIRVLREALATKGLAFAPDASDRSDSPRTT